MEARMTDLEIRLTYQEATLQALNEAVTVQQGVIDQLRREVDLLKRQLRDATPADIAAPWEETPPPHY
jgi:SlyX protein